MRLNLFCDEFALMYYLLMKQHWYVEGKKVQERCEMNV